MIAYGIFHTHETGTRLLRGALSMDLLVSPTGLAVGVILQVSTLDWLPFSVQLFILFSSLVFITIYFKGKAGNKDGIDDGATRHRFMDWRDQDLKNGVWINDF